ncbi:MAG: enterobactin/ferric enterobactin esterase [Planctomycetaceae bacterium]|nr:enterobactin/ferric enterobactin esterase [Planctomycetaceae bacterium]
MSRLKRATLAVLWCLSLCSFASAADEPKFKLGTDSQRHDGVPQGKVTEHEWKSKVFEGTTRKYWIYVPAQYDGSAAANVMVFQDGHAYVGERGNFELLSFSTI